MCTSGGIKFIWVKKLNSQYFWVTFAIFWFCPICWIIFWQEGNFQVNGWREEAERQFLKTKTQSTMLSAQLMNNTLTKTLIHKLGIWEIFGRPTIWITHVLIKDILDILAASQISLREVLSIGTGSKFEKVEKYSLSLSSSQQAHTFKLEYIYLSVPWLFLTLKTCPCLCLDCF